MVPLISILWAGCTAGDDPKTESPATSPSPPVPTTPPPPDPPAPGPDRRHDCSGIDPADPAPLGGRVALTFDDGPSLTETPAILATLRDWDAPATFFVVGEQLADPASWPLVEDLVADPRFDIANHSWDHANLSTLSDAAFDAQVDDTTALIETFGITPQFLRFPFGASDCGQVDAARERGLHVAGWHIDTADWCFGSVGAVGTCTPDDYDRVPLEHADDMLAWTMEQIRRFDGGVVLLHDIQPYTASTLDSLLQTLDAEGFEIVPLDDPEAFPRLVDDSPVDLPFLGEACDPTADACWQIEFRSWCTPTDPDRADVGVCTLGCAGLCADRPGAATTFCATVDPGAGQCIARSDSENHDCADLPGTVPTVVDRWVGDSGEAQATAEVCLPLAW